MSKMTEDFKNRSQLRSGAAGAAAGAAAAPAPAAVPKPGVSKYAGVGLKEAGKLGAGAAVGGVLGAADSVADNFNGYRDEFQKSIGADTPLKAFGGDVLRTAANVGNAVTFGGAERLGQGIANAMNGGGVGGFVDGLLTPNARDRFLESKKPKLSDLPAAAPATPKAPATAATGGGAGGMSATQITASAAQPGYQQQRLREMGVSDAAMAAPALPEGRDTLRTRGTGEFQKLSTYGGDANLYGRASDPSRPGRMNDFAGVGATARPGAPVGNSVGSGDNYFVREGRRLLAEDAARQPRGLRVASADGELGSPEQRWGAMERALRERFGRRDDSHMLARGLQRLNEARAAEMGEADRNATQRRGQDIDAETRMYDTDARSRDSALRNKTLLESAELNANARLSAASTRASVQQRQLENAAAEKGYNRYTQAVDGMFTTVGEDGKPVVDTAGRNRFLSFVQGSDPRVTGLDPSKFNDMAPQEQMAMLQEFRTMYDINEARNATADRGHGTVSNRMTAPTALRDAAFSDVANNGLPLTDYIWSNLPGTNPNVVQDETGQTALLSDLAVDADGNWDADKQRIILSRLRSQQQ